MMFKTSQLIFVHFLLVGSTWSARKVESPTTSINTIKDFVIRGALNRTSLAAITPTVTAVADENGLDARVIELEPGQKMIVSCVAKKPEKLEQFGGCSFNLDTQSPKNPAFLIDDNFQIIQPIIQNKSRIIQLKSNQQVTIACPGTGNSLMATGKAINSAQCVAGSALLVAGLNVTYDNLGCQSQAKETVKESGNCSMGTSLEVGWQVDTRFINQLTICHSKSSATTFFVANVINGRSIEADDETNKRPSFRKGGFFTGIDVDRAYSQSGQATILAKILGSASAKYIDVNRNVYLARGHLAPDGDFIDASAQDATYYYLNVLPQWQSFNNGNWKAMETTIRQLAASRGINLHVYTGGFEVLTLADAKNVQKAVYLHFDSNNNGLIPVPKYFWKMVYDPIEKAAVAFVGLNNPHKRSLEPNDVICPDICNQIPWVTWNRLNFASGYMYCCKVSELNRAIPYTPNLGSVSLLL